MSLQRLPDWSVRLQAVVVQRLMRAFGWGVHDCALYAADCVQACTGTDPAADLRGRYSTERGAARLIRRAVGEGGLAALAAARLGAEIAPALAIRGDVGVADRGDGRLALVVCNGPVWQGPGPDGIVIAQQPLRAWRV